MSTPSNVLFPEFRRRKSDCQGEFPVVKAIRLIDQIRLQAPDIEAERCERIIEHWVKEMVKHRSTPKTVHYLRGLANRIEMEGGDAA